MKEDNKDICPKCGYDRLAYFSSLQYKMCTNCYTKIPWKISYEKEKPLVKSQR
jgi:hypothetical protein